MNVPVSNSSFKKNIGIAAFVLVLLHVLFSLFVILAPKKLISSNVFGAVYNQLILLGPFFNESRIKTSSHLYINYKVDSTWSTRRDYGMENFEYYLKHPWRYDRLNFNDFERYAAHEIGYQSKFKEMDDIKTSARFRELNQFILRELIQKPVDSVSLVYGLSLYLPEEKSFRFDTIFKCTYNPKEIARSK